ncbi:AraC family transcriptional regulator [Mucilaginibacter myungsuensis]|uniref:Helix-turn-helix domain-containing protein n=1 Tax=Mucilaginibacter myungsuensis TaxID=649104 RepID=A0A929KWF9_9SPHI|nr:AraC family transcriptional regulator [Mucilaginibacter myungsuensis]MBE9662891.1 helix-turn-helix domain-containing protein [Mucilaginibacter myungsuensis]MDN3598511.1 AraC family transcriptional regulator [Mucilaginibacter myungsuensis]
MKPAIHKSSIPESQVFMVKYLEDKHFDPVWHSHSEYQLFVPLEGTGTLFIGDSIRSFGPSELVLTGSNLPHLWRSDEAYFEKGSNLKVKGVVIYLQESLLGEHLMAKEEMLQLQKLFKRSGRGLSFYGDVKEEVIRLMHELIELSGLNSFIHLLRILNLLSTTKDYQYLSHTEYADPVKKEESDRMSSVYEYILKNYRKKIRLNDLADMLYMTPTSFSRYFTTATNKGFSKFISELRVKYACKLLVETDLSIAVIAERSGFGTMSNFNKLFKEVMKKRPNDYKKEFLDL